MKAILTAMVLVSFAGAASAAGVDVIYCTKHDSYFNQCPAAALKKVKVSTPKVEPKQAFDITDKDVKYGGPRLASINTKDIRCLAYSIFREAGNQQAKDQYAVGQVHMNRLKEGSWGNTMCKVVFAKAQFSWTLEPKMVKWTKRQEQHFLQVAEGLMVDGFYVKRLASDKILHYHATYVNPKWAKQGQMVASAGDHVFYKNVPY